ncbi:MAG: RNA polymerase subunit sigma, partial [Gemmatimonadota bacterium]|nr:RNA polymerase subunit sigma [Gemmatimonadota bacterium]
MRTSSARRISGDEGSLDQYLREISQYPLITREDEVE